MKKLALTAVLAAGLSQAAGCIITSDDDPPGDDPVITADITLSNAGPNPLLCINDRNDARGMDGLRVNARLTGTQSGFSDVYNCTVTALVTPPLTSGFGEYDIWVDYINDRGFPNDPSQWVVVDSTVPETVFVDRDLHVIAELEIGYGFFNPIWSITDTGGNSVDQCLGGSSVSIISTITGTSTAFEDEFNCEDGFNDPNGTYTAPLPLEDYTIAADLIASDGSIVTTEASTGNGSIIDGNSYVEMNIDLVVPASSKPAARPLD